MKGFFLKNNLNQPLQFVFIFFNEGKANGVQGKVIFLDLFSSFTPIGLSRNYDKFIQTFNQSRVGKETDIHRVTHYVERILLPQWSTSL